jgi:hypothetical protein
METLRRRQYLDRCGGLAEAVLALEPEPHLAACRLGLSREADEQALVRQPGDFET